MVLCALPSVAWGFSDSPRAASSDYLLNNATQVNVHPEGDVIRCTASDCNFIIHRTFPIEPTTTGFVGIKIRGLSNDVSPTGVVCTQVCLSVVKPGQDPQNVQLTGSCSLTAQYTASPLMTTQDLLAVAPVDTTSTACTDTSCNGAELYIMVHRLPASGPCTSTNTEDYTSVTLTYH